MLDLKPDASNGNIVYNTACSGAAYCIGIGMRDSAHQHTKRCNLGGLSRTSQAEVDCQLHERTISTLDHALKLSDLGLQRAMFIEQTFILSPCTPDLFRGGCNDGGFGESFELVGS
jgi:hypothetical protein